MEFNLSFFPKFLRRFYIFIKFSFSFLPMFLYWSPPNKWWRFPSRNTGVPRNFTEGFHRKASPKVFNSELHRLSMFFYRKFRLHLIESLRMNEWWRCPVVEWASSTSSQTVAVLRATLHQGFIKLHLIIFFWIQIFIHFSSS